MAEQNIAVIGAGPKAAALAAKAFCLRQSGVPITVTIFERHDVGSAWSGRHGYTDGIQRLCTPAERDLGYPYLPTFGSEVAEQMQASFSWNAFQTAATLASGRYAAWVNRGRRPPSHAEFTDYLKYALTLSEAAIHFGRVTGLSPADGSWTVQQVDAETRNVVEYDEFDAVVVTGPGPATARFPRVKDRRIFTGVDFWQRLVGVRKHMPRDPDKPIVIIGGGGTAAAITAWFIRNGLRDHPIHLINNQAMLFTRTTNFFENRLFDDEETWTALADIDRKSFTRRLNRGVVWETVTDLLADAEQLVLLPGKAKAIVHSGHRPGAHLPDIEVQYTNAKGESAIDAGLVIDATGFDMGAFQSLLPRAMREAIEAAGLDNLTEDVRRDLSLPLDQWPKLHVPNLSETRGPGFGSLMVLGAMADRILTPYVKAATA